MFIYFSILLKVALIYFRQTWSTHFLRFHLFWHAEKSRRTLTLMRGIPLPCFLLFFTQAVIECVSLWPFCDFPEGHPGKEQWQRTKLSCGSQDFHSIVRLTMVPRGPRSRDTCTSQPIPSNGAECEPQAECHPLQPALLKAHSAVKHGFMWTHLDTVYIVLHKLLGLIIFW